MNGRMATQVNTLHMCAIIIYVCGKVRGRKYEKGCVVVASYMEGKAVSFDRYHACMCVCAVLLDYGLRLELVILF